MHVLAINGSPRKESSSTYHILNPLLSGMRTAGATTELVHLGHLEIKHCLGCFLCWVKSPGECAQKDDMAPVLEKFVKADLIIFGTPLYHYSMSGLLKNFIDRTLPAHEPWMVCDPDHPRWSKHPDRYPKNRSMLLVSPCGFPEFDYFEPLVKYFQFYADKLGWRYLGEILRPAGEVLNEPEYQEMFSWYIDLLHLAGEQLVRDGQITQEVHQGLRKDLIPGGAESFRQCANLYWSATMAKFGVDEKPPQK